MHTLTTSYNAVLVILSYVIAVLSSYTALTLGGRIHLSRGKARLIWLIGGAGSMGVGIWSMHFVAMLALHLPVDVKYDPILVLLSILFAVLASGIALTIADGHKLTWSRLIAGSIFMGAGIASMHYTGMEAMEMDAAIQYDPIGFAASILVAVLVSAAALAIAFRLKKEGSAKGTLFKILAGFVNGAAVVGMHYSGMYATTFVTGHTHDASADMLLNTSLMAYVIGLAALIILSVTLISAYVERLLTNKTMKILESDERYKSLFEHNLDGVVSFTMEGEFLAMNPKARQMIGESEVSLRSFISMCTDCDAEQLKRLFHLAAHGEAQNYEISIVNRNNIPLSLNITNVPVILHEEPAGVFIMIRDVTGRKLAEERIQHMVYHDSLTGLPNRRFFEEQLQRAIASAMKQGREAFVMFLDLDGFKLVNDALGHDIGDSLLKEAANRIARCVGGKGVVSRFGGDEFTVIFEQIAAPDVVDIAKKIIQAIEMPIAADGQGMYVSTSIGISRYPDDGMDARTLMKHADMAMYAAKDQGKNNFRVFVSNMRQAADQRMFLQNELNRALEAGELTLHYQPQVRIQDAAVTGVEALVRWNHPVKGLIPPNQFIPHAEESGLIVPIGEWVLRTACKQNKAWQDQGLPPARIAVNLSARQLLKKDAVQIVESALQESGLSPEYLELEITEGTMLDVQRSIEALEKLKKLGIHIAMDDFGTGFSSLSYLTSFPVDKLKIDQSFIRGAADHPNNKTIIATIISMARHLKLKVIAEGVETQEQLLFLKEQACDEVQGYLFSRPLPAEEMERYLRGCARGYQLA
ncbi:EAL domain-containing protein [Cohnella lubricantis]|uniref:EAL domain-containing protein n=1 Tax=Cohnella lubricantis TaxID=2163172 RepID=A0A841TEN5_9BACL|nr:EAL domain-containing protein [Cohnella lubricantis]MBB6677768.1 EAL domain-containing protein [Cohnella lubricantis]MBP2118086.1 diguanylate cyclase (GGDEF)-like protein/PAS domain S-box-containing protein [Cohnella lubricantis]